MLDMYFLKGDFYNLVRVNNMNNREIEELRDRISEKIEDLLKIMEKCFKF